VSGSAVEGTAADLRPGASSRARAYAFLTGSMALVGVYVALSKPLTAALPPLMLALIRFAIAAVAMLPWSLPAATPHLSPRLTSHERVLVFLQSFFGNFLFSICMLYGVRASSATAAGIIMSILPAVVALGSRVFLGERLSGTTVVAVLLAVAGIVLLPRTPVPGATGGSWLGNALLLGAVGCEAAYVVIGKRLANRLPPLRLSAAINAWGLLLMTPFGLWQWSQPALDALTPALWGLVVFYAVAASLVAVWWWQTGLRSVPASDAGVFTIALPLAATAIGVFALGERPGARHLVALAVALASIVLIARRRGAERLV
jgi:drug/metabolite transporter (DMT)-like permease